MVEVEQCLTSDEVRDGMIAPSHRGEPAVRSQMIAVSGRKCSSLLVGTVMLDPPW